MQATADKLQYGFRRDCGLANHSSFDCPGRGSVPKPAACSTVLEWNVLGCTVKTLMPVQQTCPAHPVPAPLLEQESDGVACAQCIQYISTSFGRHSS